MMYMKRKWYKAVNGCDAITIDDHLQLMVIDRDGITSIGRSSVKTTKLDLIIFTNIDIVVIYNNTNNRKKHTTDER